MGLHKPIVPCSVSFVLGIAEDTHYLDRYLLLVFVVLHYLYIGTDVLISQRVATMTVVSESSELAVISGNSVRTEIANLTNGQTSVFSTISGEGFGPKAALLNALSNSVPVSENINKHVELVNIVVESIDLANESTGEIETQPRVILIDADGTAYHAISGPIFKDVQRLLTIMGHPSTWNIPLPVKVIKGGQGTRQYFSIKLDMPEPKK